MTPTISSIQQAVAAHFGIPLERMLCQRRRPGRARQLAMYLCRELTTQSFPQIARAFDRDHTTIIHGCELIARLKDEDQAIAEAIGQLTQQLTDDPSQGVLRLVA